MSEWRGLHEQDYHSPWLDGIRALCTICQQDCEADDVCYCCQRNAEVERLTADLADRNRRIEEALALHWDRHDAFDDRYIDCGVCNRPAPCPTVQALRGESDE